MTQIDSTVSGLPRLDEAGRGALFTSARTARTFADTPVTDAELAAIWELAKWPPTAANSQPLRVLFLRTDRAKARLIPHLNEGNREKTRSAPVTALLALDVRYHEYLPEVLPHKPEMREVFDADDELRDTTGQFNATLQIGYFMLAIRAQGLAAGPMAGFDADGLNEAFFPDGRWKSLLVVNIGHPGDAPWHDRLPRLAEELVVQYL